MDYLIVQKVNVKVKIRRNTTTRRLDNPHASCEYLIPKLNCYCLPARSRLKRIL